MRQGEEDYTEGESWIWNRGDTIWLFEPVGRRPVEKGIIVYRPPENPGCSGIFDRVCRESGRSV
jgi:hypothetical protein